MAPEGADGGQRRRTVLKTAGAAAGLSLLAGSPAAGADLQQQEDATRIGMATVQALEAHQFRAPLVWVEAGTEVTWVNESGSHSSTAYAPGNDKPQRVPDGADAWDSGVLSEEGATFSQTFDTDGVYDYYCTPHESLGMVGRLVVGEPDFENQPALASPDEVTEGAAGVLEALNALTAAMFGLDDGGM